MADPHIRAAFYLSPTIDALWRWTADGEVLTWPDNTTIAFRAEVEAVLKRLAPGGLPPFGAVALVLAACREGWMQSLGRETVAGYARVFGGMHATSENGPLRASQLVYDLITHNMALLLEGLDAVSRLPRHQIDSKSAKAILAEVVFETAKNRSEPRDAALIVEALDQGINPEMLRPQLTSEESLAQFIQQVDGLYEGLKHVDKDALALRAKTGLDEPVNPAPDELAPTDAVRQLLAELAADRELAGLARLAQDLMAAVSVPRSLRTRDDLSVGGVSDLSNRGPLDRLLVSELAHDDLTLAVRVAVNEALYLRRESPPREPPHRRAILIDAGIRMWGVPRVFATAVALALAATSDPKAELAVFRATPEGIDTVDLTSREGIETHLAALETSPHPGGALETFLEEISGHDSGQTDAVLVTHADVLSDAEFSAALSASGHPAIYLASIDRDGSFSLLVHSRAGRKLVREAKLSLDTIYGRTPAKNRRMAGVALINPERDPSLPAVLYCDPFPFFLPCTVDPQLSAVSAKHGLVAAARDGRLLQWRDGEHGARQMTARLPIGLIAGVFIDDHADVAYAVIMSKRESMAYLVTANLLTGHCAVSNLMLSPLRSLVGIFIHREMVYFVRSDRVDAYALSDGAHAGMITIATGVRWTHSRFFQVADAHYTIGYNGSQSLVLERIPAVPPDAVALFDREGHEGVWAVLPRGQLLDPIRGRHDPVKPRAEWEVRFRKSSENGHRLAFDVDGSHRIVDLQSGQVTQEVRNVARELLAPQIHWSLRSKAHLRVPSGIFVDSRGRLCLLTKRNEVLSFALNGVGKFAIIREPLVRIPENALAFDRMRLVAGTRFAMSAVTWNDGSKAWLDHRGLLHLKSSDRSIPEISITLTNMSPAAWSSDGDVTGPTFFLGERPVVDASHFICLLVNFVVGLR